MDAYAGFIQHSTFNILHSTFGPERAERHGLACRWGRTWGGVAMSALPMPTDEPLLVVSDLKKYFPVRRGLLGRVVADVKAVDGVSFGISRGETLGLVGESGSGKTTVGRCILRLIEPTAGRVEIDGTNVLDLGAGDMRRMRRRMQIVFQDPYGSLNPRMTVGTIIAEPLIIHGGMNGAERDARVAQLLQRVGLQPEYRSRYPHEFSGGQRQRIGVARALATNSRRA